MVGAAGVAHGEGVHAEVFEGLHPGFEDGRDGFVFLQVHAANFAAAVIHVEIGGDFCLFGLHRNVSGFAVAPRAWAARASEAPAWRPRRLVFPVVPRPRSRGEEPPPNPRASARQPSLIPYEDSYIYHLRGRGVKLRKWDRRSPFVVCHPTRSSSLAIGELPGRLWRILVWRSVMNWFDVALAGLIVISLVSGIRQGFSRSGFGFLAIILAFLAAAWLYPLNLAGFLIVFF